MEEDKILQTHPDTHTHKYVCIYIYTHICIYSGVLDFKNKNTRRAFWFCCSRKMFGIREKLKNTDMLVFLATEILMKNIHNFNAIQNGKVALY